ncbi:MAG: hypothetical protein Kow006_07950 [Gammaproteobacteria bacterium]
MALFLGVVVIVSALLYPALKEAFLANPIFNGMIIGVLLVGIAINFQQVVALQPESRWIAQRRKLGVPDKLIQPQLLAPLAKMLAEREGKLRLSAVATRSVLDGLRMRLDEHRDVSRYLIGLLIFLGLLGTFWGLLDTVSSAGEVIAGLQVGGADVGEVFERLKQNLQGPLGGMGTAFSSSLFGLGGALVLGFFDLQAGHAENRFFKEVEDWLSELTQLHSGLIGTEGEGTVPAYIEALLEKTADTLDGLERIMSRGEDDRSMMREQLLQLTTRLTELTDQINAEQLIIKNVARQQHDLQPLMNRLAEAIESNVANEEALRNYLRTQEASLQRVMQASAAAQRELLDELRQELRLMTRTLGSRGSEEL